MFHCSSQAPPDSARLDDVALDGRTVTNHIPGHRPARAEPNNNPIRGAHPTSSVHDQTLQDSVRTLRTPFNSLLSSFWMEISLYHRQRLARDPTAGVIEETQPPESRWNRHQEVMRMTRKRLSQCHLQRSAQNPSTTVAEATQSPQHHQEFLLMQHAFSAAPCTGPLDRRCSSPSAACRARGRSSSTSRHRRSWH